MLFYRILNFEKSVLAMCMYVLFLFISNANPIGEDLNPRETKF